MSGWSPFGFQLFNLSGIGEDRLRKLELVCEFQRRAGLDESVNSVTGVMVNLAEELEDLGVAGFEMRAIPDRARIAPFLEVIEGLSAPHGGEDRQRRPK